LLKPKISHSHTVILAKAGIHFQLEISDINRLVLNVGGRSLARKHCFIFGERLNGLLFVHGVSLAKNLMNKFNVGAVLDN
jgi:hypothetical protein